MNSNLKNLKTIFLQMKGNGFDTDKPLKWGFYFVHDKRENLEYLVNELNSHDYDLEKLVFQHKSWTLMVSKVTILTPYELHKKNLEFNELAEKHQVSLYDGWDVEKS